MCRQVPCSALFLWVRNGFWEEGIGRRQPSEEEEAVQVWELAVLPGLILQAQWELGAGVSSENVSCPFTSGTRHCCPPSLSPCGCTRPPFPS